MLPSKKILIALALLIVGIGVLIWHGYGRGFDTHTNTSDQSLLAVASSSVDVTASKLDSDNDGLPDWEEALYGTDPKNPDTDGDGTPDGKEIELGRNPLIKGPNDFLVSKNNPSATSTEQENLTLTDTFARNFFTAYMNLQQSGVKVTSDNVDQIAGDYLKNATLPSISAKQYITTDLSLTDSDQMHILNYKNSMTAIFAKDWPDGENSELSVMQQAFANSDTKALDKLTPIISTYQTALNDILDVSVPKLAAPLHLDVVDSLAVYIQTLKMIQLAYTDPLSGLVGLNEYQNNRTNAWVSLTNLQMYFINSLR